MRSLKYLVILFLLGCSSHYSVSVDSIASIHAPVKKKYVIQSGSEKVKESDLQFQEFASYIHEALASLGFIQVDHKDEADVAILLSYGISKPRYFESTYTEPIYGQTRAETMKKIAKKDTWKNSPTYEEKTSYKTKTGVVGTKTYTKTEIEYDRYLTLKGVEPHGGQEIWSTKVESSGASGDLREVFPCLIRASKEYFGKSTAKKLYLKVPYEK